MQEIVVGTKRECLKKYATYLLNDAINEISRKCLESYRKHNVPLLRKVSHLPDEQLEEMVRMGLADQLRALINDDAQSYIKKAIEKWVGNQLPGFTRDDVSLEDLLIISHIRKSVLMRHLSSYTQDVAEVIAINAELDEFYLSYSREIHQVYLQLAEARATEQLSRAEEQERLLKQAQAITHIGSYTWDLVENKLSWSDELYRIYGLEPGSELNQEIVREYRHPDDAELMTTILQTAFEKRAPLDFFYRIVLKDGRIKTLHGRGEIICDRNGIPVQLIGTAQDVTDQKRIESELLQNQRFIMRLAEATPSILASYNVQTNRYSFINDALKSLLGWSTTRPLNEGANFFLEIIHPGDLENLLQKNHAAIQRANEEGPSEPEPVEEFRYRMRHANGEYRWFHSYGTVFDRDEKGNVLHVLNISHDITSQIEAEQRLIERSLELSQSNARLQQYAFIASHDLREPLRKISIFADRLKDIHRERSIPDGANYLQKIMTSAIRLQEMVNDLLSLSQLAGERSFEECDLEILLSEVRHHFDARIEELSAVVQTDGLPVAKVVRSQMGQLFQNLIHNSLKFARSGVPPVITIRHQFVDAAREGNTVHQPKTYLKLVFSDNGIGFRDEYAEKIFGLFQRLHPRELYDGTGMGLAICKTIVENHGGSITAQGEDGKGATFTILLPV